MKGLTPLTALLCASFVVATPLPNSVEPAAILGEVAPEFTLPDTIIEGGEPAETGEAVVEAAAPAGSAPSDIPIFVTAPIPRARVASSPVAGAPVANPPAASGSAIPGEGTTGVQPPRATSGARGKGRGHQRIKPGKWQGKAVGAADPDAGPAERVGRVLDRLRGILSDFGILPERPDSLQSGSGAGDA